MWFLNVLITHVIHTTCNTCVKSIIHMFHTCITHVLHMLNHMCNTGVYPTHV